MGVSYGFGVTNERILSLSPFVVLTGSKEKTAFLAQSVGGLCEAASIQTREFSPSFLAFWSP
jgi:hypothetical protein